MSLEIEPKINITLKQLQWLLNEQKRLTASYLLGMTYYYNPESTAGHSKCINIDKEKFNEVANKSEFPKDFETLKQYL
ncbi:hypothetical protein [Flavobacterium sp.]|uniref:hypothetical protein n=1 Tax=Flavobacterium sp. TaxID=239 RepID=UPI00326475F7